MLWQNLVPFLRVIPPCKKPTNWASTASTHLHRWRTLRHTTHTVHWLTSPAGSGLGSTQPWGPRLTTTTADDDDHGRRRADGRNCRCEANGRPSRTGIFCWRGGWTVSKDQLSWWFFGGKCSQGGRNALQHFMQLQRGSIWRKSGCPCHIHWMGRATPPQHVTSGTTSWNPSPLLDSKGKYFRWLSLKFWIYTWEDSLWTWKWTFGEDYSFLHEVEWFDTENNHAHLLYCASIAEFCIKRSTHIIRCVF